MVLLFANRKSVYEKEIIEILKNYGGNYISDKTVFSQKGKFTIVSRHKITEIESITGIAIFCDESDKFLNQNLPCGFIGICEDTNKNALENFKRNNIPVICCGINSKNTITLSSINSKTLFASLQRTVQNSNLKDIEPTEFKIKLSKNYSPFSVMACVAILLLKDITPDEF